MIKKIKYFVMYVIKNTLHDSRKGWDALAKPREVANLLFWLFIISMFTGRYNLAKTLAGLYVIVYLWRLYKQGKWREYMRQKEYLKLKEKDI